MIIKIDRSMHKNGTFLILIISFLLMFTACSSTNSEKVQKNGDEWLYLNGLSFENYNLEVKIDFPENWKNRFIIVEHENTVSVFLKEAKESAPELNVGTLLFSIISVDKYAETDNAWAETVGGVYFGESKNKKIYLVIDGEIMPSLVNRIEDYSDMGILSASEGDSVEREDVQKNFDRIVTKMITITNEKNDKE